MISGAADRALIKSKTVIISTIINRDDDKVLSAKAAAVNAYIKFKFINNDKVVVCINENLKDKRFRCDNIHLTDRGVSRFANNLKYSIAKALDISVKKKMTEDRYNQQEWYV